MTAAAPPCDRFEREGLLALERGLDLDPHFETCPQCLEARVAYERLQAEVAGGGRGFEPPTQWQARVWAEVARRGDTRRRHRWWRFMVPVAVGVAAALVLMVRWFPAATVPDLTVAVVPGEGLRRGVAARPGDRLELSAETGTAVHAELRVYRDDAELVLRCSVEEPCRRRGENLWAAIDLPAIGSYQPLLLISGGPIAPPTGRGLDADAGAALDAGARVELGDEIRVE